MSFWSLLNTTGTVYRRTALVLDATVLDGVGAADRAGPDTPYAVEVEVEAPAGAVGSVTVAGLVSGATQSQVLDFAPVGGGNKGRRATTRRFDAGSTITLSETGAWADAPGTTISAAAVDGDGTQRKLLLSIASGVPMRIDRRGPIGRVALPRDGSNEDNKATLFLPAQGSGWTPRSNDEVVDDTTGIRWRVESTPSLDDSLQAHHYELPIVKHEIGG